MLETSKPATIIPCWRPENHHPMLKTSKPATNISCWRPANHQTASHTGPCMQNIPFAGFFSRLREITLICLCYRTVPEKNIESDESKQMPKSRVYTEASMTFFILPEISNTQIFKYLITKWPSEMKKVKTNWSTRFIFKMVSNRCFVYGLYTYSPSFGVTFWKMYINYCHVLV